MGKLTNLIKSKIIGKLLQDNFLEIEPTGFVVRHGSAQAWNDLQVSLIGQRLYNVVGSIDYDFDENCLVASPSGNIASAGDRVIWNYQYPHSGDPNHTLNVHMHWEQVDAVAREITLQYRVRSNLTPKNPTWTTVVVDTNTNNLGTYPGSGTFDQVTPLIAIPMSSAGLSARVQMRLTRSDAVAGDINIDFVDAHVRNKYNGSRKEFEL